MDGSHWYKRYERPAQDCQMIQYIGSLSAVWAVVNNRLRGDCWSRGKDLYKGVPKSSPNVYEEASREYKLSYQGCDPPSRLEL